MRHKRIIHGALVATAAALGLFLATAAWIVGDGLTDDVAPTDVGVVLGTTVYANGRPSAWLRARLERAVELYERGMFPEVIVSGAVGREGRNEAVAMRDYLISRGVPADRIITDERGRNTFATGLDTAEIARERGYRSVLVVSQYFHITRTRLVMRRLGFREIRSAHARHYGPRDLYSTSREVVALAWYLVRTYPPAP